MCVPRVNPCEVAGPEQECAYPGRREQRLHARDVTGHGLGSYSAWPNRIRPDAVGRIRGRRCPRARRSDRGTGVRARHHPARRRLLPVDGHLDHALGAGAQAGPERRRGDRHPDERNRVHDHRSGDEGEDYLRISPTGVDENTNSLSAFLNGSLVIQGLPQQLGQATPNQPAAWKHVSDKPVYAWHDHRIHWMAQQQPPVVAAAPGQPHHVFDWVMPLKVADRPVTVKGSLDWTGKPGLTGLPLALLLILSVILGLCLATLLLRLHLKRKQEAAVQTAELQDTAGSDDDLLPAEPARSSLTER